MRPITVDNALTFAVCPLCACERIRKVGPIRYRIPTVFADTVVELQRQPELWTCEDCSSSFTQHVVFQSEAERFYSVKRSPRWESTDSFEQRRCDNLLRFLRKLLYPNMKVCDFGCSIGSFLDFARNLGCETFGIEYSSAARDKCSGKGHRCFASSDEARDANLLCDAMFCLDTLEHIYEVGHFLNTYRSLLKRGGMLCMLTGNVLSLPAKLTGNNWWYVRYPEHILFPSLNYLSSLDGFRIEGVLRTFAARSHQNSWRQIGKLVMKVMIGRYDGLPPIICDHVFVVLRKIG
jgi:hypothetical protein